jgi:hypothetical protein
VFREPREHQDLICILLHGVRISRGSAHHINFLLPKKSLFSSASRSSIFAFDFFHSRLGFERGGDTDGDDPAADPAASSRDCFFPPAVFKLLDGDGFILQVH